VYLPLPQLPGALLRPNRQKYTLPYNQRQKKNKNKVYHVIAKRPPELFLRTDLPFYFGR
jgi:hypothetical protein